MKKIKKQKHINRKVTVGVIAMSMAFGQLAWADEAAVTSGSSIDISSKAFPDVTSNYWGHKFITKLALLDVVKGSTSGIFNSDGSVSHEDAVIMAVKMLGYTDEQIEATADPVLPIQVDNYARKYIAMAISKGLISIQEEENGNSDSVIWGKQPATREWVAKLVVRAAGKQAMADELSNQSSSFNDSLKISAWALGYVNAAVSLGVVSGFAADQTFRPDDVVTRAQMTAFLSNAVPYLPSLPTGLISGKVLEINASSIRVLLKNGETAVYSIAGDGLVYGKAAAAPAQASDTSALLEAVKRNYEVQLVQSNGTASLIDVTDNEINYDTFTGILESVSVEDNTLSLTVNGQAQTYSLSKNVVVLDPNGEGSSLSALLPGSSLELTTMMNAGETDVDQIQILKVPVNKTADGFVDSVDTNAVTLSIKPSDTGVVETYPIASNAAFVNESGQKLTASELVAGDAGSFVIENSVVTSVTITQSYYQREQGRFVELKTISGKNSLIYSDDAGKLSVQGVSPSVQVVIDGLPNAKMTDLTDQDELSIIIQSNDELIHKIVVTNRKVMPNELATVVSYDADNKFLMVKDEQGDPKVFEITSKTALLNDGVNIPIEMFNTYFQKNYKVRISYTGSQLLSVDLSNKFTGTITQINTSLNTITLTTDTNEFMTLTVGYPYIEMFSKTSAGLNDLKPGDKVQIVMNKTQDRIDRIAVMQNVSFRVVTKDVTLKTLTLKNDTMSSYNFSVGNVPLTNYGGSTITLGELAADQPIVVSFIGRTAAAIKAVEVLQGEVTAVDTTSGKVTVQDYVKGACTLQGTSFHLKSGTTESSTLNFLKIGDRIELYGGFDGEVEANVLPPQAKTVWKIDAANQKITFRRVNLTDENVFSLAPNVYIHKGSQTVALTSLKDNDSVRVYFSQNKIVEIEVL